MENFDDIFAPLDGPINFEPLDEEIENLLNKIESEIE